MSTSPIQVEISNRQTTCQLNNEAITRIVIAVLYECHFTCQDGTVSLSFVSDEEIRDINKKYLGRDYYTDVISFPLMDENSTNSPEVIGEIIISVERALDNAAVYETSLSEELTLYIIHGILHLLGYNDSESIEKKEMQSKENELLKLCEELNPVKEKQ